jgi:hypothetical protein
MEEWESLISGFFFNFFKLKRVPVGIFSHDMWFVLICIVSLIYKIWWIMYSYADINFPVICIIFAFCWHQFFFSVACSSRVSAFIRFIDADLIYIYSELRIRMEARKCICTIVRLDWLIRGFHLWNETSFTTLYSRVFLLGANKSQLWYLWFFSLSKFLFYKINVSVRFVWQLPVPAGTGFELRPGHERPWLRYSVVFLRPSGKFPGW